MATPIVFDGSNRTLKPAKGTEGYVQPLPIFTNGTSVVTCWQLTEAERASIIRDGRVYLSILSGQTTYPVFIGDESSVREVVADTGPTFKHSQKS